MAHEKVLSNDGVSLFLLNSGGSLLLNGTEGGVHPANLSTQKIFPKKKLVNVEFKFWLRANLLEKVIIHLHSLENRISRKGVLSKKPQALTKTLKQTILKLAKTELSERIKDVATTSVSLGSILIILNFSSGLNVTLFIISSSASGSELYSPLVFQVCR